MNASGNNERKKPTRDEGEGEGERMMNGNESPTTLSVTPNPLVAELMPQCLSNISKTGTGLEYSYVRFVARNRGLTDIDLLKAYKNLRYVDISENQVQDVNPLSRLTYLLSLKADSNLIREGIVKEMPFLQFVDFSKNVFADVEGVFHPELEILHLKSNRLKSMRKVEPHQLNNLHTLELRGNQLETTNNLDLPSLKKLYLAQNKIERLEGLDSLQQLAFLHLRSNRIAFLDGFSKKNLSLYYLNLRDNKIGVFEEIHKLKCLPNLKELVLLENEINEREDIFLDILMHFPNLMRINKTHVTNADKREAKRKLKRITEEAEEERKRLEEEEEEERKRQEAEEEERLRNLEETEDVLPQTESPFSAIMDRTGGGQDCSCRICVDERIGSKINVRSHAILETRNEVATGSMSREGDERLNRKNSSAAATELGVELEPV